MPSALRSAIAFAFASALVVLSLPGCSQQAEGERCDFAKNGNDDCDSGLTCVSKLELLDRVTDRCCPPAGTGTEADKRCRRGTPGMSGAGGSTAGGSTAGGSTAGGSTAGGSTAGGSTAGSSTAEGGSTAGSGGSTSESEAGAPAAEAGSAGASG